MCKHKRTFSPPLSRRTRADGSHVQASDIPCAQCITESNRAFAETLRKRADAEKASPEFNPLAPFIKGIRVQQKDTEETSW